MQNEAEKKEVRESERTPARENREGESKSRKIAYTALLAALLCVLSPFALPIGPVPISLGLLAVYIVSSLIGLPYGLAATGIFVALGAIGVPVFTGFTGGFAKIAGPTGGYIVGYLPCSLIIGLLVDAFEKKLWVYPLAFLAGTAVLYAFGTAWFMLTAHVKIAHALTVCVLPFLLGDALKMAAASALCYKLRFVLKKTIKTAKKRL